MSRNGRNGHAALPAVLLAGTFLLPLFSRTVEWMGLPRELRMALPIMLGVVALASFEGFRWRRGRSD